jgi:hypothetical protein
MNCPYCGRDDDMVSVGLCEDQGGRGGVDLLCLQTDLDGFGGER